MGKLSELCDSSVGSVSSFLTIIRWVNVYKRTTQDWNVSYRMHPPLCRLYGGSLKVLTYYLTGSIRDRIGCRDCNSAGSTSARLEYTVPHCRTQHTVLALFHTRYVNCNWLQHQSSATVSHTPAVPGAAEGKTYSRYVGVCKCQLLLFLKVQVYHRTMRPTSL